MGPECSIFPLLCWILQWDGMVRSSLLDVTLWSILTYSFSAIHPLPFPELRYRPARRSELPERQSKHFFFHLPIFSLVFFPFLEFDSISKAVIAELVDGDEIQDLLMEAYL